MPISSSSHLLIVGAGGHGRVVVDAALAQGCWAAVRVVDRNTALAGSALLPGINVEPLGEALPASSAVHVAIGCGVARESEARLFSLPLATVVHPGASVSPHAGVSSGSFLAARCVVAPGARVGIATIVNHGAVVDHDVHVGDFTHIAPLATLGGEVRVGARSLVGAGANVLPGVRICDDVVVGAGSVVCRDIDVPGVYAGVPARRLR